MKQPDTTASTEPVMGAADSLTKRLVVHCRKSRYDVYIGRPSPFGNPFVIGKDGTREDVIRKYEHFVRQNTDLLWLVRRELRGKILGCWCAPLACHGDVLARIANEQETT